METMWVLLLQVAVWLTVDRLIEEDDRSMLRWALVSGALMILIRADGFVTMFFVVAYLALRRRSRYAAYMAAATGGPLAMLVLWRLWYYGYPLPDTYYVKVTGHLAIRLHYAKDQVIGFAHMWPHWALILAYAVHTIVEWRRGRAAGAAGVSSSPPVAPPAEPGKAEAPVRPGPTFPVRLGPFLALGLTVYFFWTGGDYFEERFLLFHVPLAVCALFEMGLGPSGGRGRLGKWAVAAVLMIPLYAPRPRMGLRGVFFERKPWHNWADLGRFLGRNEKGKVLAIEADGDRPSSGRIRDPTRPPR